MWKSGNLGIASAHRCPHVVDWYAASHIDWHKHPVSFDTSFCRRPSSLLHGIAWTKHVIVAVSLGWGTLSLQFGSFQGLLGFCSQRSSTFCKKYSQDCSRSLFYSGWEWSFSWSSFFCERSGSVSTGSSKCRGLNEPFGCCRHGQYPRVNLGRTESGE